MSITSYSSSKIIINNVNFIVPTCTLDDVGTIYPEIYIFVNKENENDSVFVILNILYS